MTGNGQFQRPAFNAIPCSSKSEKAIDRIPPLETFLSSSVPTDVELDSNQSRPKEWTPVLYCPFDFGTDSFLTAVNQLVDHPEYNSTLILRSETIEETSYEGLLAPYNSDNPNSALSLEIPPLCGMTPVRNVKRKLLPRRPTRDPSVTQNCTFYSQSPVEGSLGSINQSPSHELDNLHFSKSNLTSCLVLTPLLNHPNDLPYYHPAVFHLAFRYLFEPDESPDPSSHSTPKAYVRIEVVPLPSAPDPIDLNSRLYRTCLALLEAIHRYGWGAQINYSKRVQHDCLFSREEYQDLYLVMRERHKHIVGNWQEATDPLKHVFEDIGIATYLMLLWKHSEFVQILGETNADNDQTSERESLDNMPWIRWPRPPGGFLDFGCGNGLLVHILLSEGYIGEGIDVRARTSWSHYPPETQKHLHVHSFDPLEAFPPLNTAATLPQSFLRPGVFVIANHADELTPWTPVLATITKSSGFLSIPCCPWAFDAKFDRAHTDELIDTAFESVKYTRSADNDSSSIIEAQRWKDRGAFIESLKLGGADSNSRSSSYSLYRIWLANLTLHCGWEVECDTLRIPSTRNWAIVGTASGLTIPLYASWIGRRLFSARKDHRDLFTNNALEVLQRVKERGIFRARRSEGRTGDQK